tara:strand:- start:3080 stop:4387 length:1308 start_codon:yes stop_codon:yes gene_type:complete
MNNLKQYAGLLNDAAPKGEFLAYINDDEAQMLKDAGAKGLLTPQGIPSYRGGGADMGGGGGRSGGGNSGGGNSGGGNSGGGNSGGGGGRGDNGGGGGGRDYSPPSRPSPPSSTPPGGGGGRDYSPPSNTPPTKSPPSNTPPSNNPPGNDGSDNEANPGDQDTFNPETGNQGTGGGDGNGNVDAEDEYLAPDSDHFKATQKAIGKTNKELKEQGLDKSEWTDYTKTEQEAYQKEMNRLNGTEGKNYSFYKGNKGTTNLTFNEHFKDVVVTDPILKFSPTMRLLVAAGRTIQENATTSYGTGSYGSGGTDGSGAAVDQGGWIGKVLNSDGSVKSTLTESEAQNIYQQAQSQLPYQIGNTKPQKSMVNDFFKNMGSNLGVSTTYMNTYNQAKNKISQSLNLTPNTQQFGYTASPYSNYSRSMTSANPYYDELENQGLI